MKLSLFSRKKQIHNSDGIPNSYYTSGEVFDGGAERFVYNNEVPHPLIPLFAGIGAGQIRLVEPQRVYQYLSLPVQAILPGVQAGQVNTNPLFDPNATAHTDNAVLLQSVFGGVQ